MNWIEEAKTVNDEFSEVNKRISGELQKRVNERISRYIAQAFSGVYSNITIERLLAMEQEIRCAPRQGYFFECERGGIVEPNLPQKIGLSSNVVVADKFRVEFNDWLLDMFGREKDLSKIELFRCKRYEKLITDERRLGLIANCEA